MELIKQTLAAYGATIDMQGVICRNDKVTGVAVVVKGKRIRFESTSSRRLMASGPIIATTVEKFVESFWFWEKI